MPDVPAMFSIYVNDKQAQRAITRMNARWATMTAVVGQASRALMMSIGYFAAVGGAVAVATMAIKDYEEALVRAGAIGGLTATQTSLLSGKMMESARAYGAASEEMAEGVLELTKSGFDFATVMSTIDTVTKVNIANNLSYAESAKIATLVMKAFKVESADLEGHLDKLQFVVHKTLMDMGDFLEVLQYAGGTTIFAGVPPEHLYAMAGALADVAQVSGVASRGLNRVMIEMLKEIDVIQEWTDSLGLGVDVLKDGKLNITELMHAFHDLGMTEETLIATLNQFSIRSARAWLGLLTNAEEYFELVEGQKDAHGYLDEVVEPQLQTLANQWQRIIETVKSGFRDEDFLAATHDAFDALQDTIEALMPDLRELVLSLLEQAPAMFAMLTKVLQGLIPVVGPLLTFFTTMADVLAWLNEMGLLRSIILFTIIRKMTPLWTASIQLIGAAIAKTGMATVMMSQGLGAFVWAFFIILSEHRGWVKALLAIAFAIAAVTAALAAFKAVTGQDISAGLRGAIAGSLTALALGSTLAFMTREPDVEADVEDYTIGGMQRGSRYIPRDMTTTVHEGERIVTEPEAFFGGRRGGNVVIINRGTIYGNEDALKRLIKRVMKETAEEAGY